MFAVVDAWGCKVACESNIGPDGLVQPADGATDVPVDVQPVALTDETVRLVGPDGSALAASARPPGGSTPRLVRFSLDGELLPDTEYRVVEEVGGVDTTVGTFTTGQGRGGGPPPAPSSLTAVGRTKFDLRPGHGLGASCGGFGEAVVVDVSWPHTTGVYELRAHRPDGSVLLFEVGTNTFPVGWEVPCVRTAPGLAPQDIVQVEVRSVDAQGRLGPWSEPVSASAAAPRR